MLGISRVVSPLGYLPFLIVPSWKEHSFARTWEAMMNSRDDKPICIRHGGLIDLASTAYDEFALPCAFGKLKSLGNRGNAATDLRLKATL
jgi:hypothetical protein